jgi:hypothetical protein
VQKVSEARKTKPKGCNSQSKLAKHAIQLLMVDKCCKGWRHRGTRRPNFWATEIGNKKK